MASDWEIETPEYIKYGLNVFNFLLLGDNEEQHINNLLNLCQYKPNSVVCDMGCGIGYVTDCMRKTGIDIIGVTNSEYQYNYATNTYKDTKFKMADMENTPFHDNNFNAVQYFECIGYSDIQKSFNEDYRILKSNGRVIVKDFSDIGDDGRTSMKWSYKFLSAGQMISKAETIGFKFIKAFPLNGNIKRYYEFYCASDVLKKLHNDWELGKYIIPFWYEFVKL